MFNTKSNLPSTIILKTNKIPTLEFTPRSRRRSIIREFALNTSTHGLPGIARSQSKHNCIFWTISFLIFTGITIYFVSQSIQDYFQYPTQTSVSFIVERSQTFPAVTFCNYSPLRFDRFIKPFINYTNLMGYSNTNDTSTVTDQQAQLIRNFLRYKIFSGESMNDYLFSLDSMLLSCYYNGNECNTSDFISFLSSIHGLCYTFNAKTKGSNSSPIRSVSDNGGDGKFELRLYASSHLYVPYVSKDVKAGMIVMIHDNTELPLIDIAGIELTPGLKHKISYKKKAAYFLPPPYSDCTNNIPPVMSVMFDEYGGADYRYSQGLCYSLCTQAYIYQECGCVDPFKWTSRSIVLPGTNKIIKAQLCNESDSCYKPAAARISNTVSIWDEFCSDCNEACSTVDFVITPSATLALSATGAESMKDNVKNRPIPVPANWSTTWQSDLEKNYVGIDIVCESTQIENYTQEASISGVSVLSNVGGHTGLWIGISFLSIMEFVEMLYRLCRYEFREFKRKMRTKFETKREMTEKE